MPWFGDGSHHSSGLIYFFGLTYTRIKGGFYMDTQYYKEFTQLALEKNFSRAAASLHMSHTTLHRHISMMEKEVGAPLIVRTTPIKLTAIGRKVLEKASIIAAEEDEILKIVKRDRASVSGEVRVLVPSFMSTATEVASALYTVKKRYPEIALIIVNSLDDSSVSQGLLANKIDIGLSHRYFKTGCDVACEMKRKATKNWTRRPPSHGSPAWINDCVSAPRKIIRCLMQRRQPWPSLSRLVWCSPQPKHTRMASRRSGRCAKRCMLPSCASTLRLVRSLSFGLNTKDAARSSWERTPAPIPSSHRRSLTMCASLHLPMTTTGSVLTR